MITMSTHEDSFRDGQCDYMRIADQETRCRIAASALDEDGFAACGIHLNHALNRHHKEKVPA
jgi:hypothetical protein